MRKISVFYGLIWEVANQCGCDFEEAMEKIKACGINAAEMTMSPELAERAHEIKAMFDRRGFSASCFCTYIDLLHGESAAEQKYIETFETAAIFDCKTVLCVPGFFAPEDDREKLIPNLCQGLEAMCEKAKEYGITVTIEDYDGENSPCCTTKQVKTILDAVKDMRFTFDIGNFLYCEDDPEESFAILKDKIAHCHCKDRIISKEPQGQTFSVSHKSLFGNQTYLTVAGEGEAKVKKIVSNLTENGYSGAFVLEHGGFEDQLSCIKKSVENIVGAIKNA